jgi:peptide/nickel transport system substrate-binding protein
MEKTTAWWEKLGKPQYGGELVIRANRDIVNFDPYFAETLTSIHGAWMERLVSDDWTVDPEIWDFKISWHPSKYLKGQLAESWEFKDPRTHIIHLRKGVHWQNIPPANGREFTADDVVFHYNRLYGMGGGFTKPSPFRATDVRLKDLISVTALDKYTIVFKFKTPNPENIMETLHNVALAQCLENPDAIKKWGDVTDWHHAIGTGPFILKDFVPGKSATLVKNPDYWGHDERYPQNKLPYVDSIKFLIIPDDDKALEMMRAGKIDIMDRVFSKQSRAMQKSNPEIQRIFLPRTPTVTLLPRNDVKPFNDIRVRTALQMAIDLPAIAKSHYGGFIDPYPSTLTATKYMKGWGFPYEEWPQELKDQYAYNPVAAKKLLAEAGYPHGFETNVIADTDGDLELLNIVKAYFADIGINMEIRTMDPASYTDYVENGHKHDQMVYRPYGPLGQTYAPLRAITRLHTGTPTNYSMVNDPVFDAFFDKATAATDETELKQVIKDANERVARQHYAISLLQPLEYSLCQPWIKGYHAQIYSIWMGVGGASMLSFYGARYWIDKNMKTGLAH